MACPVAGPSGQTAASSSSGATGDLASSMDPTPRHGSAHGTMPQESRDLQLRYRLSPPTFGTLYAICRSPSRRDILRTACLAAEFRSFPMRKTERAFFREINDHTAIPYTIQEYVSDPWHKAFLLVQVDLQRSGWPNKLSANGHKQLHQEKPRIYALLESAIRCLIDILGRRRDGRGVGVGLDVLRSIKAGVWEGNVMELLQVDGIGIIKMGRLTEAGIQTVKQLSRLDFCHIERLLSRNPPFGHRILQQLAGFPRLTLRFEILAPYLAAPCKASLVAAVPHAGSHDSRQRSWIARLALGFENEDVPLWNKRHPWVTVLVEGRDEQLVWFWRGSAKRLVRGKEIIARLQAAKGETLKVSLACEEIVGTMIQESCQVWPRS